MFKSIVSLVLLSVAGVAQAAIPANVNFDGYCDGFTGLTKNGYGVAGTWRDVDCAGTSAMVGGSQGKAKGALAKGYIMGSTGMAGLIGQELTWTLNGDNTWTIYSQVDGSVLNAGTWSAAAEGAARGTKSTIQK
jgi:hypothetical protein